MFAGSADVYSGLVEVPVCKWPLLDPTKASAIAMERTVKALHQK